MERLSDLLFELSSLERMRILNRLKEGRLKLSHVAQELDITVTESSRHLQRLQEANLIDRDSDGFYYLTNYGEASLELLSGLGVLSGNREYILNHDLSVLPYEFLQRIGVFSDVKPVSDTLTGIRLSELMYEKAEEFIWVMSEQVLISALPTIYDKIRSGIDFRFIFPEDIVPPPGFEHTKVIKEKSLPEVRIRLIVTEKEALICLPYTHGALDYSPFIGSDMRFIQWAKDLFLHYWGQ